MRGVGHYDTVGAIRSKSDPGEFSLRCPALQQIAHLQIFASLILVAMCPVCHLQNSRARIRLLLVDFCSP